MISALVITATIFRSPPQRRKFNGRGAVCESPLKLENYIAALIKRQTFFTKLSPRNIADQKFKFLPVAGFYPAVGMQRKAIDCGSPGPFDSNLLTGPPETPADLPDFLSGPGYSPQPMSGLA